MKFVQNLKISHKLLLLFGLLLIPTIILFIITTSFELKVRKEILGVKNDLEEIMMISRIIHEFQEERALTYGYLTARGNEFGNSLQVQREYTNAAVEVLEKYLEENNIQLSELQLFSNLHVYRSKADNLELDSLEFESFYQTVREEFLSRLREEANQIDDQQLRNQLQSVVQLVSAKEYLGQLRTFSNHLFTRDTLNISDYNQLGNLHVLFDQHMQMFQRMASEELREYYIEVLNDSDYRAIGRLFDEIRANAGIDASEIDGMKWYERFTASIENFRKVEIKSYGTISQMLEKKLTETNMDLMGYFFVILVFISLAVWFSVAIIRYLISTVFMLRRASGGVSRGLAEVDIPLTGNDEFGILAASFRKVVTRNKELAMAANAIGEGDYDVPISAPDKDDILKDSIIRMRNNLKALSEENQKRSWLLSGLSQLNDLMGGTADLEQLSKKIIDFVCEYTDAGVGAFFIRNQDQVYRFSAGYSLEYSGNSKLTFKTGEGIAGEAALKRKPAVISDVPAGNFILKTGLSETGPLQLLIIPAVYEKETIAVLEIASKDGFTELQQQFIYNASERIAIAVTTLKSNIETQELLHETQSQAEELENQQSELKQINAQLNQQRDELEASEEELRVSQQEMEEKNAELEEKTTELEEQHEILSAKNRELEEARQVIELKINQVEAISNYKTEFLANMSHELRTPLNSIMLLSRILMDNARLNGNEKDAEHAKIIQSSGSDLLKLINEILDLSRVESGKIDLDIRETDLRSLNTPNEFTEQARNKDIRYEITVEKNVPERIKTDQFRLEQIIRNLLSNAFKFTPEGGKIDFQIYKLEERGKLKSDRMKGAQEIAAFAVKDNGPGIPKEKQKAVFEAFQQADASTTRKYGGTGLGLAICKELAGLLGGEIQLESKTGKGSTFTLFLPVEPVLKADKTEPEIITPVKPEYSAESPAVHSVLQPSAKTKNNKNETSVLIIEDDKGFNNVLADFARNKQFHVEQAFTGAEGLEKLHKSPPDALLLDVKLPDMTGWDILRNMINNNLLKRVQVHLMTAYDYKNELSDYPAFNNFLQKPVTLESVSKAFLKIAGRNEQIKSMLIIEDNEVENHAIADLLSGHEISTTSAFSGKEALEKMESEKPDGIIIDLKLPDTDGYQVMEEIRKKNNEIPIIVYSGKEIDIQEETKLKKYANTIIVKNDYSYQRLMDEVKLFLHQIDYRLTDKKQFKIDLHVPDAVLKNKKVLLVDDDVRNIYSLYSVLEKEGMEIIVANDGKEAIEKLKEAGKVNIILMDIMMPEMDGIEATKRIKNMPEFRSIPVIAVTAKAMKEDREKCIQAGASDYISKPIDVEKLVSLMRVWVYDAK